MNALSNYCSKRTLFPPQIKLPPEADLGLVITIPCYNEIGLLDTLFSLTLCELPDCAVEVIICVNSSETAEVPVLQQNEQTVQQALGFALKNNSERLRFHILHHPNLPKKHAGVGLARKIAMDEAIYRFEKTENPSGVIACLDADTLVQPNYLLAVFDFFEKNPNCQAASIHYEHPISPQKEAEPIVLYELHLRYYVHALRWAGLKTATQTVGSAMAVRAVDYAKQGGMNRRKAGEDFYFIHKFTPLGGHLDLTETTVIPSPRVSERVPFGTGKAIGEILGGKEFSSYNPLIFSDLSLFLKNIFNCYCTRSEAFASKLHPFFEQLPKGVKQFLEMENAAEKMVEIHTNTKDAAAFEKRFFQWFEAFLAMKYVHFMRDGFYPNMEVSKAVQAWRNMAGVVLEEPPTEIALEYHFLAFFREKDRKTKDIS